MDQLEALKKELADVKQVNRMLTEGMATMGVAYVNQRVNLLADELSKAKARIGDLEGAKAKTDERLTKAVDAFKRLEGRVGKVEFKQSAAETVA